MRVKQHSKSRVIALIFLRDRERERERGGERDRERDTQREREREREKEKERGEREHMVLFHPIQPEENPSSPALSRGL